NANAYTESDLRGVTVGGSSAPTKHNVVAAYGGVGNPDLNMPIKTLTRGTPVMLQGGTITELPVAHLDPRAANDAVRSFAAAPHDGFFTQAMYRGAFSANKNWLCGWTAADAFGFILKPAGACLVPCPSDINNDETVNIDDLVEVITHWGNTGSDPADINQS